MSNLTDFFPSSSGASTGNNALLIMVGGGGGAAIGAAFNCGAAGGDILCTFLSLQPGVTCPIVVGAGGAAGCTNPTCCGQPGGVGGNGGHSSFGNLRAPGGGGAGTQFTCTVCIPATPYSGGCTLTCVPTLSGGGVGASHITGHYTRALRSLPLSYSGIVGSIARRSNYYLCFADGGNPVFNPLPNGSPQPSIVDQWGSKVLCNYPTILFANRMVTCTATPTPVATLKPGCPGTYCQMCRVVCSNHYNVQLGGNPYSQSAVGDGCSPICQFPFTFVDFWPSYCLTEYNIANNSLGCTRFSGLQCCCHSIPNNSNTGHSGKIAGCNGDSGVVVLFYPTTIPAATSFPGGIDCTPVSCPFGMRAYKFTSSGSITI